jgi:hypothetical protein
VRAGRGDVWKDPHVEHRPLTRNTWHRQRRSSPRPSAIAPTSWRCCSISARRPTSRTAASSAPSTSPRAGTRFASPSC